MQTHRSGSSLSSAQTLLSMYEQQVMTQRQYQYGSDSPYKASQTLGVQSQIERKNQNSDNIDSTQKFLAATDSTLSQYNSMTDEARSNALAAINTTTSAAERSALAQSVKSSLQQMFNFGNDSFERRYLFAGSTTNILPLKWGTNSYTVEYTGSETNIHSWSNTDLLSQSNISGAEAFGAVSAPVRGRTDLNPALKETTLLKDLNGGKGVERGSIRLEYNNGATKETLDIDLSKCASIADVKRAIEGNGNTDFPLTVNLSHSGLELSLPENFTGTISVSDVNKGKTAAQLGITGTLSEQVPTLKGSDINPVLRTTTGIADIDFDLDLTGIQVVNGGQTFDIPFENCQTVGDILAELNHPQYGLIAAVNESKTGIDVRSRISGADFCIGELGGQTATQLGIRTTDLTTKLSELDYNRGVNDYDGPGTFAQAQYEGIQPNSSLLLTARNEGKDWNGYQLNFTTSPDGKIAMSINEETKSVNITINPGVSTACQIIEAFYEQTGPKQYFDLTLDPSLGVNDGSGVVYDGGTKTSGGTDGGIDFTITRNDGTVLEIDVKGAETIGDILRIINEHPDNADGKLAASLSQFGNGIELTDNSTGDYITRVDRELLSTAAQELGLVDWNEEYRERAGGINPLANTPLIGNDPNPQETRSLFTAMIRLQTAMEKNDTREIERSSAMLDETVAKLTASRATVGIMQQSLDNVKNRLAEENTQHESVLDNTLRIDYADASLNYLGQQTAYQASMQVAAAMLQMSLLNYL
ncbi:MAG: hypothetical protein LBN39_09060 [Planctomycetaceae bacterium]|nr:hypothetical protein [Planctomycetaceae bacterium]